MSTVKSKTTPISDLFNFFFSKDADEEQKKIKKIIEEKKINEEKYKKENLKLKKEEFTNLIHSTVDEIYEHLHKYLTKTSEGNYELKGKKFDYYTNLFKKQDLLDLYYTGSNHIDSNNFNELDNVKKILKHGIELKSFYHSPGLCDKDFNEFTNNLNMKKNNVNDLIKQIDMCILSRILNKEYRIKYKLSIDLEHENVINNLIELRKKLFNLYSDGKLPSITISNNNTAFIIEVTEYNYVIVIQNGKSTRIEIEPGEIFELRKPKVEVFYFHPGTSKNKTYTKNKREYKRNKRGGYKTRRNI
jgi:hypothetical protein